MRRFERSGSKRLRILDLIGVRRLVAEFLAHLRGHSPHRVQHVVLAAGLGIPREGWLATARIEDSDVQVVIGSVGDNRSAENPVDPLASGHELRVTFIQSRIGLLGLDLRQAPFSLSA